jgi:hypothetical protein
MKSSQRSQANDTKRDGVCAYSGAVVHEANAMIVIARSDLSVHELDDKRTAVVSQRTSDNSKASLCNGCF